VVCLAPSHALLRSADGGELTGACCTRQSRNGSSLTLCPCIRAVRFAGGEDGGAPAPVSGKHKRNSLPFLRPVAVLARVSAPGQPTFGVRTCVRGALLEANERLLAAPGLLHDAPHCEGFVAILRPADGALNELRATALTQDAYRAALAARDAQAAAQQ